MARTPIDLTPQLRQIPQWDTARFILETLEAKGWAGYVVGGAVRDLLLRQSPGDVDLLTDAGPEAVRQIFPDRRARHVGRSFKITLVGGVEVASLRRGGGNGDKLAADLGRRDFTINSMAWDPFSRELVDPYKGRADLENRIIRFTQHPEDRIGEDPVRMVRACRFAAEYNGRIHSDSLAAIREHSRRVWTHAPGERIRMETLKAMVIERPSRFFALLYQTGLLAHILPCLDRCAGLDGGPYHGETVFEHCLLVGDALPARQPLLRLAGFLHDTGKFDAARIKNGALTFAGHETRIKALASDLKRLRFSNRETDYILALVRVHMRPLNGESTPRAVRRLIAMLTEFGISHRDFLRLRIADKGGNLAKRPYTLTEIRVRLKKIQEELAPGHAFTVNDLGITGREIQEILGLSPGPEIGRIKQALFEQVLDDPALNTGPALDALIRKMAREDEQ